jgi:hypothetical protein
VLLEKTTNGQWRFRDRLLNILQDNAEVYATNLEKHFIRHLNPFISG